MDPAEKIALADCRVGAWVEVSNGGKEPWRGMIAKIDATSSQPIAVKWVGRAAPGLAAKPGVRWPSNTPDGLYTWRGGIHFIELETLLEVNDYLFHVAHRKGLAAKDLPCKPTNVFCHQRECDGRCVRPPAQAVNEPGFKATPAKKEAPNAKPGKAKPEKAQPAAKAKPKPPVPKTEKNKPGPKPKPKEAAEKKSASEKGADKMKGSKALEAAEISKKTTEEKKRKYGEGLGKYFEWEHNITADCHPSQLLVPFTYHTDRIFNLEEGGVNYKVEKRVERSKLKCTCSRSLLPSLTDHLGTIENLHQISKGACPWAGIHCGGILYHMHVYQDPMGRGYGIRALEPIKKGALICEYSGEVITGEEATLREHSYSQLGLYYLHDVQGKFRESKYTIDPTMYGNVARMLNHSCDPNVTTLEINLPKETNAMGDGLPKVPRLVLFAKRDIKAEEEMCIDYSPGRTGDDLKKVMRCFCKTPVCKGWLF